MSADSSIALPLRARHLELICRRALLAVHHDLAETRRIELAGIAVELEELYAIEPQYPFDRIVEDAGLQPDEAALLALVLAWELMPDARPSRDDASNAALTVGRALELLFSGSERRLLARALVRPNAPLLDRGLLLLVDPHESVQGTVSLEQQRFIAMPWLADVLLTGAAEPSLELASLHRPDRGVVMPTLLRRAHAAMTNRREQRVREGLVLILGTNDATASLVDSFAHESARPVLRVSLARIDASTANGLDTRLRELGALAGFYDAVLFFEDARDILSNVRAARSLLAAAARSRRPVFIGSELSDDAGSRRGHDAAQAGVGDDRVRAVDAR